MIHDNPSHFHHLPSLLHSVASQLDKQSDQALMEQLGLGFSQFKIMQVMEGSTGVTQRYVAEQLGQTEASVSRQVKQLHQRGLTEVVVRPDNKREHRVWLTRRGLRLYREATLAVARVYQPVLGSMDERARRQLYDTLRLMRHHL